MRVRTKDATLANVHYPPMPAIRIIYSSTSGHTEYVVNTLATFMQEIAPHLRISLMRVEHATKDDLKDCDLLILGSGTWNYGGVEGQLNETMHRFLFERAEGISLLGRKMAFISLGDDRYYHTTRCTEKFMRFLKASGATMALTPLIIVNEPYGQEEKIKKWSEKLAVVLEATPTHSPQ